MRARLLTLVAALVLGMNASAAEDSLHPGQRYEANLSIQETLKIAAANARADTFVRLLMRSGGSLDGTVQAHRPDKASVAILHSNGLLSIVSLGEIVAVTVIDRGAAKLAFQGNRIFMEPGDAAPTPLAFRRQLRDWSTNTPVAVLVELSDAQIDSATCRFYSTKVLDALGSTVDRTLADGMGREALSRVGNRIRVVTAPESLLELAVDGSDLTLRFNCEAPLDADYAERISQRLEDVL